jgi:YfiH family protein
LSFKDFIFEDKVLGQALQKDEFFIFFGNINSKPEVLKRAFHDLDFCFLKQVHGDTLVPADPKTQMEADAHYTQATDRALCISTADCIPMLGYNNSFLFAAHAGWRGVFNGILPKTLRAANDGSAFQIYLGPHIQAESLEVDASLGERFSKKWTSELNADPKDILLESPFGHQNKIHLKLSRMAELQMKSLDLNIEILNISARNTLSDTNYASYRRGHGAPQRNLSFVARRS